jgi:hypothetical protein
VQIIRLCSLHKLAIVPLSLNSFASEQRVCCRCGGSHRNVIHLALPHCQGEARKIAFAHYRARGGGGICRLV